MRVLQGVTGQAGQPHALAKGLKEIGIHAETCSIADHKFGYEFDHFLDLSRADTLTTVYQKLMPLIESFDIFHFHARSFVADWPALAFPAALDILLLKMHRKKVFFHYRGQEIRLANEFAERNPFHYVDDASGWLFKKMPDESKLRLRDFIFAICDGVFVTDPELQTYVPGATVVPRALDADQWPFVGVSASTKPLVVHAPSRRGLKGTDALLQAATELSAEGLDFELRLVENVSHAEAVKIYREADIIVDQLRIGWYGVLAVEGMALGKPVIAYIREDLWQKQKDVLPIVNANPITIKERLRDLIVSPDLRHALARASRDYFLATHSASNVAKLLSREYEKSRPVTDLTGITKLLDHQMVFSQAALRKKKSPKLITSNSNRVRRLINVCRADGIAAAYAMAGNFLRRKLKL
jgi:hypothetical protein